MSDAEFTISREDGFPAWFDGMLIGTAEGTADVEWCDTDEAFVIVAIHFATVGGGTRKLTGSMNDVAYRKMFLQLATTVERSETYQQWVQDTFADEWSGRHRRVAA